MKKFIKSLVITFFGIACIVLLVWVVMLLWNIIIPDLTGWNEIDFWQCAGLCLMFRLLTGHIGVSYGSSKKNRRKKHRRTHSIIKKEWLRKEDKTPDTETASPNGNNND